MERDFIDDDFEVFLKQKADQYKIYPSDHVWKNIYNTFHSKKKWLAIGGSLVALTGFLLFYPGLNKTSTPKLASSSKIEKVQSPVSLNPFQPKDGVLHSDLNSTSQIQSLAHFFRSGSSLKNSPFSSEIPRSPRPRLTVAPLFIPSVPIRAISLSLPVQTNHNSSVAVSETTVPVAAEPQLSPVSDLVKTNEKAPDPVQASAPRTNWLQETAAIKLTTKKKSPYNLQFYFSPTVSYRRLADNKFNNSINQQNLPFASRTSNIDRYVEHNPSVGAELGSNVLLAAGKNFTVKTGLQLNYSRYSIKAYKFYFEKASIALNSVSSPGDTLTSYTSFRNFGGYSPEQLQNQYLQVSMPIGAELKLLGNKNLRFSIAGTVQPSYLLFNDTYLLSTDYVNYAKQPSLVRKWNVHTSVEAFVSYRLGGVTWQFGPQFRYQLLSSYTDRYPIKEYLMEYGVKVGISKTLR